MVYPRKVDKGSARIKYRARINEGVHPNSLLAAARAYGEDRAGEDPKFTKHAATFLGPSGVWEEWYQRSRKAAPVGPEAKVEAWLEGGEYQNHRGPDQYA